jgi:hypothetical protein
MESFMIESSNLVTQFFHKGISYTVVSLFFVGVSLWGLHVFIQIKKEVQVIREHVEKLKE